MGSPKMAAWPVTVFGDLFCPPQMSTPKGEVMLHVKIHTQEGSAALAEKPYCPLALQSKSWGMHARQCYSLCKVQGGCREKAALQASGGFTADRRTGPAQGQSLLCTCAALVLVLTTPSNTGRLQAEVKTQPSRSGPCSTGCRILPTISWS